MVNALILLVVGSWFCCLFINRQWFDRLEELNADWFEYTNELNRQWSEFTDKIIDDLCGEEEENADDN